MRTTTLRRRRRQIRERVGGIIGCDICRGGGPDAQVRLHPVQEIRGCGISAGGGVWVYHDYNIPAIGV